MISPFLPSLKGQHSFTHHCSYIRKQFEKNNVNATESFY